MIKVNISKDKIILKGHSLYDDLGKDIVCSSVSSIVITTVNAILSFDENYITYIENKDSLEIDILIHNKIVDTLITNMNNLLYELERDYPKNIKIRKENY